MIVIRDELHRLCRYGINGIVLNFLLYLVFIFFLRSGFPSTLASGLCYVLGIVMSYLTNRRWAFSSTASHGRDLPRFLLAYGFGFVSAMLIMVLLVKWLPAEAAQVINIGITAVVIYTSLRLFRFGRERCEGTN